MGHPKVTWLLCAVLTRALVRLRVRGRGALHGGPRPAVIVCNHLSWIDPILIIAAAGPGRPIVFLAAREHVEKRPALDRLLAWLGVVIKVERGAMHQRETFRAAQGALSRGVSLALFPEGRINTRQNGDPVLLPLEPGAAVIARRSGVPILPLAIAGSGELHVFRRVTLACATPIPPGAHHRDDDAATECIRETLLATMAPTPPLRRWRGGRWLSRMA